MIFREFIEQMSKKEYNNFLEKLSSLEHSQWAHWTKYMLDNLNEKNFKKWKTQIKTPYTRLSNKEKDSDREWAKKTIQIIKSFEK